MKCNYEFNQSKLKSQVIEILKSGIPEINVNAKETRRKISQCNTFFASLLIKKEIHPRQYMSFVRMAQYLQDHALEGLAFLKGCERTCFFSDVERNGFDIFDLFVIHQKRQKHKPKYCTICDYIKTARQITIRNENRDLDVAKNSAGAWKIVNDVPDIDLFCFNYRDGVDLEIHMSKYAQSYVFAKDSIPPIDIHLLCTKCHEEVERFVAIERPVEESSCDEATKRKLDMMKSKWFRKARIEEMKKDLVCSLEGMMKKNKQNIALQKSRVMMELTQSRARQR